MNDSDQKNLTDANNAKEKKLFKNLALVLSSLALIYLLYYFFISSNHIKTDNAYVGAETSQVSAAVGGVIKTINFTDTAEVKVGDVLVEVDDSDAQLSLALAKANLTKAEALMNQSQSVYKRRKALRKVDSASEEEVINSKNDFMAAEAAYAAAKATSSQAELDLSRTIIKAPIEGIVGRRQVQLGQRVQAGTFLLAITPKDQLHVDANFKEVQLRKVKVGQSAKVISDKYGSSVVYHGKVVGFSGATGSAFAVIPAQNATGNWIKVIQRVPVRIELDPEELRQHSLQVGLSMQVDIKLD